MHARKAWLSGLSPKENREIPPLDYARVYGLKAAKPELTISINGGIADIDAAAAALGGTLSRKGATDVLVDRPAKKIIWCWRRRARRGSRLPRVGRTRLHQNQIPTSQRRKAPTQSAAAGGRTGTVRIDSGLAT